MAHAGERLELERAFSGATVHDMFNMRFGKRGLGHTGGREGVAFPSSSLSPALACAD